VTPRLLGAIVAGLTVWITAVTATLTRATRPAFPCSHCDHDDIERH
jgi:hypothetical protein